MDIFAKTAEPFAIVNVILDSKSQPIGIVGGHYIKAHEQGIEIAKQAYSVTVPKKADLVVSDARDHDADMTQANKGLFSAVRATVKGGEILLVTECPDRISPVHGEEMTKFGRITNEEVKKVHF